MIRTVDMLLWVSSYTLLPPLSVFLLMAQSTISLPQALPGEHYRSFCDRYQGVAPTLSDVSGGVNMHGGQNVHAVTLPYRTDGRM